MKMPAIEFCFCLLHKQKELMVILLILFLEKGRVIESTHSKPFSS